MSTALSHDIDKYGVRTYWDVAETQGKFIPMHCIKCFEYEADGAGTYNVHLHLPQDRNDAIINLHLVSASDLDTLMTFAHAVDL